MTDKTMNSLDDVVNNLPSVLPEHSGIIICGHGSRAKIAEEEFSLLAKGLRARFPTLKIEYGFLEYSSPNIHMALDRLREQGVKNIFAVPGMLFAATHAKNDIPSVLTTYKETYPELTIAYGKELGLHDEMISAFQHRVAESLGYSSDENNGVPATGELYDTMLVVVGRGTSVVDANADAAKLTRIISENLGFGWSETVYSGVTYPSVGRGLEMALKLGFKKIVVAPYFLFGGRLIDRIYAYVDKVAAENPDVEFIKADYLRDQSHVLNTFVTRIAEIAQPKQNNEMGLMEDFQRRLAAGEVDVHHHHAEFQPDETSEEGHQHSHDGEHGHEGHSHEAHSHSHSHSHEKTEEKAHSHAQEHGHHHAPYKHIAHPFGPRTMINDNVCCCFMRQFPQSVIDEEKAIKAEAEGTPVCKR
jgi:sirohydrochlorin cobaltochelatase